MPLQCYNALPCVLCSRFCMLLVLCFNGDYRTGEDWLPENREPESCQKLFQICC